ncbi:hypothetical protein Sme01_09210 [Sphaerisporangium melleum]|uniref:Prepilin type IV endopeptidase peptidase domain-containing protein n=1 Tax=Sphaerisporangium melleum TaxID=321316 RepID=A0A917QUD8_9ACTN|nr:A24 family peptidase [Sphaerisporangium melleum]GGK67698.1 hypothetical protein GCM10007964_08400 [Sphaerisporangium melleum]GII68445.1 hypothetical protein Sme01_09210 [Sphaerisporangium melleum]
MSFIVAGAALAGLVAGPYIRALAGGFQADLCADAEATAAGSGEPGMRRSGAHKTAAGAAGDADGPLAERAAGPGEPGAEGTGDDPSGVPAAGLTREQARELRRVYRAEARAAFRGALRTVPVPAWPPSIEVVVAAVAALVAWRITGPALLAPWLYMAVAGCALAVIDWRTQRLPDALTLPSYPVLAALLAPSGRLGEALLGGLALAGAYAVLWLARPGALGLGDVKLAGLTGMLTGALGLDAWLAGAIAGQALGALYAVVLLVTRRGTLRSQFPLGPFILLGPLAALLAASPT